MDLKVELVKFNIYKDLLSGVTQTRITLRVSWFSPLCVCVERERGSNYKGVALVGTVSPFNNILLDNYIPKFTIRLKVTII